MIRIFLVLMLSIVLSQVYAKDVSQPLSKNKAFAFSAYLKDRDHLVLEWHIAPNYYLYKDQLRIRLNPGSQVWLGELTLPVGKAKQDAVRGHYEVYTKKLVIPLELKAGGKNNLTMTVYYQGCGAEGFCYSPTEKELAIDLATAPIGQDLTQQVVATTSDSSKLTNPQDGEQIFAGKNNVMIILTFLGLGLLLAFTPCILPMVPILSGIIIGHHKKRGTMRAFSLSLAYVLGMALAYACAGMLVAMVGSRIQIALQQTWVIITFSGIFLLMALSLFGVFQLRLPSGWQQRLTSLSHRQKGGTYLGVFLMGAISSLIVSPCISPPLVGVLAYIAQTGNIGLGGVALLALGIGMGIPLLVIGASHGRFLPKTGHWMVTVERLTGVMMLAFAIWMLGRIIPGSMTLLLWALLLMGVAVFLGDFFHGLNERHHLRRSIALLMFVYSIILLIGAVLGNSDPLQPWATIKTEMASDEIKWVHIKNKPAFERALAEAKKDKQLVMLDFYADWCVACVNMKQHVFTEKEVKDVLSRMLLLHIDITENSAFDQELMQRYNVIAPPTFVFIAGNGIEMHDRIVGEANAADFIHAITTIKNKESANAN